MKRCVIIGGAPINISMREYIREGDYIIAADAGYISANKLCVKPDLYVGDYDSVAPPKVAGEVIRLPFDKDDTDIMYAAREAVKRECTSVRIIGGMGGRFDHTIANMHVLVFLEQNNVRAMLCDENNEITVLLKGEKELLPREEWYVSFFPVGDFTKNVTIKNLKYTIEKTTINKNFPICVSNEYRYTPASISIGEGSLFIVHSRKD